MPRIYLSNDASDVAGYKQAYVDMRSPNTTVLATSATTTTGSGDDIQCTDTAGGTALAWITAPFGAAKTLVTQVFCNVWAKEATAAANCCPAITLTLYTAAAESTVILDDDALATETSAVSTLANRWMTAAVTSQAFAAGDRLVIKLYASAVGTMGAVTGGLVISYDSPTENTAGDTYIDIQENFRVNKFQYGAGTAPIVPALGDGFFTRGIDAFNDGVNFGFYPMNATIRSAVDALTFQRNLLSPVTKQAIPT